MSTSRLADRNMGPAADCEIHDESETELLLSALKELLDRLAGLGDGGALSATGEIERWEGGAYLYLETPLPGSAGAEIEVSIQGGRAFIRMA